MAMHYTICQFALRWALLRNGCESGLRVSIVVKYAGVRGDGQREKDGDAQRDAWREGDTRRVAKARLM